MFFVGGWKQKAWPAPIKALLWKKNWHIRIKHLILMYVLIQCGFCWCHPEMLMWLLCDFCFCFFSHNGTRCSGRTVLAVVMYYFHTAADGVSLHEDSVFTQNCATVTEQLKTLKWENLPKAALNAKEMPSFCFYCDCIIAKYTNIR